MKSVGVRDPHGRQWKVSVRMLPWSLQWRGPLRRSKERPSEESDGEVRAGRWYDWLDFSESLSFLDDSLGGFVMVIFGIVAVVIAILFVLPAFIFLAEVLIVALLVVGAIAIRVLFRRPWLVDAVADDGTRWSWKVVGYNRSRAVVDELAGLLQKGVANPSVRDAVLAR